MSKTLRCTVTLPLTMVLGKETLKEFAENREEARKILAEGGKRVVNGEHKFFVDLFASDASDDAVLEVIMRDALRKYFRNELVKELSGSGAKARVGDITVVYAEPLKPVAQEQFGGPYCQLHDATKACTALCERFKESV